MDIIIHPDHPGLGDQLTRSTIIEILAKQGHQVYLSSKQEYRNTEVKQLLDMNPYLRGYSEDEPNFNVAEIVYRNYAKLDKSITNYQAILEYCLFGKWYNKFPKIWYKPKKLPEWENVTFVDFNTVTNNIPVDKFIEYAKQNNDNVVVQKIDYITKSIFDYIDIINSCKKFVCGFSGSCILGATINSRNVECYLEDPWIQDVVIGCGYCYHYENVNYISVTDYKNSLINITDLYD